MDTGAHERIDTTDQVPPSFDDIGIAPLLPERAADGTKTRLPVAPPPIPGLRRMAAGTKPPPIPVRVRGTTMPPPIPKAAQPAPVTALASSQIESQALSQLPDRDGWIVAPAAAPAHEPDAADLSVEVPIIEMSAEVAKIVAPLPVDDVPPPSPTDAWRAKIAAVVAREPSMPPLAPPRARGTLPPPARATSQPGPAMVMPMPPPIPAMPPLFGGAAAASVARRTSEPMVATPPPVPPIPAMAPPIAAMPPPIPASERADVAASWFDSPADAATTPRPHNYTDDVPLAERIDALDATSDFTSQFAPSRAKRPNIAWTVGAVAAIGLAVGYGVTHRSTTSPLAMAAAAGQPAVVHVEAPAPAAALPMPAAPAAQSPSAAPVAAPAAEAQPAISTRPGGAPAAGLVLVPITSAPSGATVSLVDGGNVEIVGHTPVSVSVEPNRAYDIVVTLADHGTKMAHLDPRTQRDLAIALDDAPVAAAPPAEPLAAAPVRHHHHVADHAPAAQARVAVAVPAVTPAPVAQPAAGRGILRISSKPPCELVIDGKVMHLSTPQRALPLAAGHHQITMVNAQLKIHQSFDVTVDAKKPTTLIQNFMK